MYENFTEIPNTNESDLTTDVMTALESGEREIAFELIAKGILEDTGKTFTAEELGGSDSEAQTEMHEWLDRNKGVAKTLQIFSLSTAFAAAGTPA